ncbi:integrin alpha [Chlamydiota bacterium]
MRNIIRNSVIFVFISLLLILSLKAALSDFGKAKNLNNLGLADVEIYGVIAGDQSGYSIAGDGDFDGDGTPDVLIGAPLSDSRIHGVDSGKTYLFSGCTIRDLGDTIDLSMADHVFFGENVGDQSGYAVAFLKDIDGDTKDEIIIGAPYNEDEVMYGSGEWRACGKTYIVFSTSLVNTNINLSSADRNIVGQSSTLSHGNAFSGRAVAGTGDVDGDGLGDLLIGSYSYNGPVGSYHIGNAYVLLGSTLLNSSNNLNLPDHYDYRILGTFSGSNPNAGKSLAFAGDVDGDGKDDFLIAAPGHIGGGTSWGGVGLFLSTSLTTSPNELLPDYKFTTKLEYPLIYDLFGESVAGAGDVDGDGLSDIIIGEPLNDEGGTDAGKVYIFLASTILSSSEQIINALDADYALTGAGANDQLGCSVAGGLLIDDDNSSDILIGAKNGSLLGSDRGMVYVVLGKSLQSGVVNDVASYFLLGEYDGDLAGHSIASAGDINGDGLDDVIVSAPGNDDNGPESGKVYIVITGLSLEPCESDISGKKPSKKGDKLDLEKKDFNERDGPVKYIYKGCPDPPVDPGKRKS